MICLVTGPEGQRAGKVISNAKAIDTVVAEKYSSKAMNADEVVDFIANGGVVEDWTTEKAEPAASAQLPAGGENGQG